MKRIALGVVIIVHGLGHANAVIWASPAGPAWLIQLLWLVALLGYLGAGLGVLRVPIARDRWKGLMIAATVASLVLLVLTGAIIAAVGAALDAALLVFTFAHAQPLIDDEIAIAEEKNGRWLSHPRLHRIAWGAGALLFIYAATVVAVRPVYLRWGTTEEERAMKLPGDEFVYAARYRVDHAITINAPADSVWPWLVQLGQDRGGFYSHASLERLAGVHITNASRIHPEWQALKEGDLVRAVQPGYFGGRLDEPGWRVRSITPGRAIVLENWGAFVVDPRDSNTSRLIIRTRGAGTPSLAGLVFGPLNVFVFEPAHFIMQRAMMRGIRVRAEHMMRTRQSSG